MTNKQRYQQAFGALHVSKERLWEVYAMRESKKTVRVGRAVLIAVCVMALLTVTAYAANEVTDGWVFGQIECLVDGVTGKLIPRDEGYRLITEDGKSYDITVTDGTSGTTGDGSVSYEVYLGEGDDVPGSFEMQFTDTEPAG